MALYHRHRPQTFSDIVGQAHVTQTLINQITHDKIAHAYLFSGPRGVGKTTIARILAKSLNCENKKGNTSEPCNTCQSCEEIGKTNSIDVIEIDAASHTGVDNVRQNIIDNAQFKPTTSKHKIFIIDEVHMLSTAAFNALLKTLEEPPSYVVFILATTDPHKLPATIISRCQRFNFSKVPNDEMTKHLKKIGKAEGVDIEADVLERIMRKSEGCARDAISLLDQLMATGEKKITSDAASLILPATNIETQLDFTNHLIHRDASAALAMISELVGSGHSLPHFATDLTEFLRVIMIAQVDIDLAAKEMDLTKDAIKKIKELLPHISQLEIVKLIDLTMRRSAEIKRAPLPQLPLEMLVIEWCGNTRGTANSEDTPVDLPDNPITKEDVENIWQDCIGKLEKSYPSMIFVLKGAQIPEVTNNTITIAVGHAFHAEKFSEKETLHTIEKTFGTLLNANVKVNITVAQDNARQEKNSELQDLAAALGGEVVS